MKLEHKFLFDYETLFVDHTEIYNFENCLLVIPYSSFTLFNEMLKTALASDTYTQEEKEYITQTYKPFVDFVFAQKQIFHEILHENKQQSSAICLNTVSNLFMCFTNSFVDQTLSLNNSVVEQLNQYDYDVLASCHYFGCPLFTTNKFLLELIQDNNLDIFYMVPEKKEN